MAPGWLRESDRDLFNEIEPSLRPELLTAILETSGSWEALVEILENELKATDPSLRQIAARLWAILLPPWFKFETLKTACLAETDSRVLKAFIRPLARQHWEGPTKILFPLLARPDHSVVAVAIEGLSILGVEVVPDLPNRLKELLAEHRSSKTILKACCKALANLGPLAFEAIPLLLEIGLGKPEPRGKNKPKDDAPPTTPCKNEGAYFALSAAAHIDPTGDYLQYAIKDDSQRQEFLDALARHWATETPLYGRLHGVWVVARLAGPPPGHQRMKHDEIRVFLFGDSKESTCGPKQSALDKRVDDLMERRQLRAIRVSHGTYDVRSDDLKNLREIFGGQP